MVVVTFRYKDGSTRVTNMPSTVMIKTDRMTLGEKLMGFAWDTGTPYSVVAMYQGKEVFRNVLDRNKPQPVEPKKRRDRGEWVYSRELRRQHKNDN